MDHTIVGSSPGMNYFRVPTIMEPLDIIAIHDSSPKPVTICTRTNFQYGHVISLDLAVKIRVKK
jgi:hypothetical protein